MDATRAPTPAGSDPSRDRGDSAAPAPPDDEPGGGPVQEPLPFPERDPIPFALTARARRVVAPASLPDLTVIDDPAGARAPTDLDDPRDLRPSRARALRRAGTALAEIARELDADPYLVATWVDEVAPVHSARRRLRAVSDRDGADAGPSPVDAARERFDERRQLAADDGRSRLTDPGFAGRLGVVAGIAAASPHALVLTTREPRVADVAARWLWDDAEVDRARVRVLLRIAPQAPGDLAAHEWAAVLGLPAGQVSYTRWRAAPDAETVEAVVRVADPEVAARFAGWRDALLATLGDRAPESPQ